MLTNDHPQDSIPAFVLGTLDIDEALLVNAHILQCPTCRAEMETFQAVLGALAYAAAPREPPAHIKQQLLARIAAAAPAERDRPPARATSRWMRAVAGGTLALALSFGVMLYDINSHVASIGGELSKNQQSLAQMTERLTRDQQALALLNEQHDRDRTAIAQISSQHEQDAQALAQLREQIARDQQVTMFIAAPQTIHRALGSADRRARATMYMQPDNTQAVLMVEGMPRVEPGKIYQFWLAKPGVQVPSVTFDVTDDGLAVLWIEAPAPVNQYYQVMVTIERSNGATLPSDRVVLSGSLSSAPSGASRAD